MNRLRNNCGRPWKTSFPSTNRARYEARAAEIGEEALFIEEPKARGYLRPRAGYRLYDERDRLLTQLKEALRANGDWLRETLHYPL